MLQDDNQHSKWLRQIRSFNILSLLKVSLVLSFFITIQPHLTQGREIAIKSGRTFRQQVNTYLELLEKEMLQAKNNKERFHTLQKVEAHLRSINGTEAQLNPEDQAYIQSILVGFKAIPSERGFKRKKCSEYQTSFHSRFEFTPEGRPQDESVKMAWSTLQSLCH